MRIKWQNSKNRGVLFWKNLSVVLLITCIPMALIGVILYYFGTDRIGTEVNKAHQYQLNQSMQQIEDYFTNLENIVIRVAFDRSLDETLNQMDFIQQFEKTGELLKSFALMKQSNPLINSVALYLPEAGRILGDESGLRTVQTEEDRRIFNSLLDKDRIIYWNYSLKKITHPASLNKAIIIRLPGGQMVNSFGAFIIYLDQTNLNKLVQKLAPGEGLAFLINENGEYLTTFDDNKPRADEIVLEDALKSRIMKENLNKNQFIYDWQDQSYSVSYGKISKFGGRWTVIFATPISQIVAPVTSLSNIILWISVFGLIIGLLLSWVASNKIYDPIYRLKSLFENSKNNRTDERDEISYIEARWQEHLQEQQSLSERIKHSIPLLRESFLLQFLQGNLYTHTESEIIEKMRQLEWDVEHKRFAVLVAQLHGISELGGKYSERDSQLISFAASNILLELCSGKMSMTHVVNFQDLSVGAFFVLDEQHPIEETIPILNQHAQEFIDTVNHVLRMKVTIVIGKITDSIMDMPDVLEQTRKALRFRDLHTSNQMLDMNHGIFEDNPQTHFPADLEREIVRAISLGLEEEGVRLIREFMRALESVNSTELMVHQGMMKLLGTVHDTMIKHDVNLYALYQGAHLYEQLMQIQEPDEIVDWFQYNLIRPFIKTLSIAYDAVHRETIEKLLAQIHEQYLSDVSLEMYADQLQMSPSKLSKAFRQITGTNYIDYIVRLRVDKCKDLLITTDMKINDIASHLHYQPAYLIRMFKKSEGITPGQYREKWTRIDEIS